MSSLKSGYLTRDSAKEKIAGTAQINIGEDNTDYTSDSRKFWSTSLTGPKIDIGGTAVIEMNGTGKGSSNSDTPVVSMRGRCLVDMCGSRVTGTQEVGYGRARTASWWPHPMDSYEQDPFDSTKRLSTNTVAYPYLHMHDESTILMDGAPILNMRGNSMLSINGDVCIDINGRNPVNRGGFPSAAAGYGDVAIDIRPGTAIQIGTGQESTSSDPTTSMLRLTKNQFVVASALPKETNVSSSTCISQLYMDTTNGYATSYESEMFPFKYTGMSGNTSGIFNFYDSNSFTKWDQSTMNQKIGQWSSSGVWQKNVGPVVWMQGKSRIKIGDGGTFSAALGGLGNVSISMEPNFGASTEIYMASASYSADVVNIANESNSFTTFHHGAAPNAATKYEFTPHGNTMFRFNPKEKFFMNVDCSNTEMLCQWTGMYGFFQGSNNYALLDGEQTHLENVGNTFIMRDDTTQEVYAEREGQDMSTTIYKFRKTYQPSDTKGEILTTLPTDEADFASTQLAQTAMTQFNSAKSSLPSSESIHNEKAVFYCSSPYDTEETSNPYNQDSYRYWDYNYPMEFSINCGSSSAAIEFDSTTALTGTQDTTSIKYITSTANINAIIGNVDFINAVKNTIGQDLTQLFSSIASTTLYYKRSSSNNTYHYTLYGFYVHLRQTFTVENNFFNAGYAPTPVAANVYPTSSYYANVRQKVIDAYPSSVLPTGWTLITTSGSGSANNMHTYTTGTNTGLNKWKRGAKVVYSIDPFDNVAWSKPVQTGESGGTKPVFQMYNRSNFMMRADTIFKPFYNEYVQRPLTTLETYEFTPTDTYIGLTTETIVVFTTNSYSTMQAFLMSEDYRTFVEAVETQYPDDTVAGVISWSKASTSGGYNNTIVFVLASVRKACELEIATFINSADYAAFTTHLTTEYPSKELWRIAYLQEGEDNKFVVYFGLKDPDETEFLKDPSGDEPIFEMVGKSQLRMYNGAYIKGESKNGETVFTFGSTTTGEAPVSFTLAQLAAAIAGGGGTQLPDAANEQF